jgi:acyl carrier protein
VVYNRDTLKKATFLNLLDELLEAKPGTIKGTENLKDVEAWDSLAVVGFIAIVDQNFGVTLAANSLKNCRTVADLIGLLPAPLE